MKRETIESEKAKNQMHDEEKQENAEEAEEEEEDDDEEVDIEELEQQLHDIENIVLYTDNGRLPDEDVVKLMKAYLGKNMFQNQGYVLDGYPKTTKQVMYATLNNILVTILYDLGNGFIWRRIRTRC